MRSLHPPYWQCPYEENNVKVSHYRRKEIFAPQGTFWNSKFKIPNLQKITLSHFCFSFHYQCVPSWSRYWQINSCVAVSGWCTHTPLPWSEKSFDWYIWQQIWFKDCCWIACEVLTPLDFFLWSYLKRKVYATPPKTWQT